MSTLTVRLDPETEQFLQELAEHAQVDRSSLIRSLIRQQWQRQQAQQSVVQRMGGHPAMFLETLPEEAAERPQRRHLLMQRLQHRREQRAESSLEQD